MLAPAPYSLMAIRISGWSLCIPSSQRPKSAGVPPYHPSYRFHAMASVMKFKSPIWLLAEVVGRVVSSWCASSFNSLIYSTGLSPDSSSSLNSPHTQMEGWLKCWRISSFSCSFPLARKEGRLTNPLSSYPPGPIKGISAQTMMPFLSIRS